MILARPAVVGAALLAGAFVLIGSARASADVPSPGRRNVAYSFSVKGLAAAPDRVLFAYPCGTSNGAPTAEHRKLEEGAANAVGRRGGSCEIYSISKTAYEAWLEDYEPSRTANDPALEKLVGQAQKCTGAPSPSFSASSIDPRGRIEETLEVATSNATTCVLTSAGPTRSSWFSCAAVPGDTTRHTNAAAIVLACAIAAFRARRRA